MPLNNLITFRRGTSSEWSAANPILDNGEPGWDVTNNILKIGDGIKSWSQLEALNHKKIEGFFILSQNQDYFFLDKIYQIGSLDVFLNGVKLVNSEDYIADDGQSITLNEPAASGSVLEYTGLSYPSLSSSESYETVSINGALIVNNLSVKNFKETVYSFDTTNLTDINLSLSSGTFIKAVLTNNTNIVMPSGEPGQSFTLFLNSGSGNYDVSFSGVLWPENITPIITKTAEKTDIFSFIYDGESWYGNYSQNYGT